MRRYNILFLTFFLSALFVIIGINFSIDPAGLFRNSGSEAEMVKLLFNSNYLSIAGNYDERQFKKYFVLYETTDRPITLITGSSRSMQISGNNLGSSVLNLSVSGASIEDHLALGVLGLRYLKVNRIVIGLDPWVFNVASGQNRWESINLEFEAAISMLHLSAGTNNNQKSYQSSKFAQLLNWSYTESSINTLLSGKTSRYKASDNGTPESGFLKIRRDGSLIYASERESLSTNAVSKEAATAAVYSLGNFSFSKPALALLDSFVRLMQKTTKVDIFLPPYHPIAFEKMNLLHPELKIVEDEIRRFAESKSIKVWGSYDPNRSNCSSSDFYDEMHPKDSCIRKIFVPSHFDRGSL